LSNFLRRFGVLAAALVLAAVVACSDAEEPVSVDTTPTPVATQPAADAAPATTPTPAPSAAYNSTDNMYLFFSGQGHPPDDTLQAIELAVANNDKSMVPVMIEMLRFFGNWDLVVGTKDALGDITGADLQAYSRGWFEWMEWLGRNGEEYAPPDQYVQWKTALMSQIDHRFGDFLSPAAEGSRINVAEIAWGGVRVDGIPPLEQAPVVAADGQDYMLPSDRVFGVSINGKHRAYPLRIVNAHEMANDILGGEPISLAY
jgi:hypothetical protein